MAVVLDQPVADFDAQATSAKAASTMGNERFRELVCMVKVQQRRGARRIAQSVGDSARRA